VDAQVVVLSLMHSVSGALSCLTRLHEKRQVEVLKNLIAVVVLVNMVLQQRTPTR